MAAHASGDAARPHLGVTLLQQLQGRFGVLRRLSRLGCSLAAHR